MVRSLVAVLALTATAARAQENPESARSPGATAPPEEGKVMLASRSPAPGRDAGSGSPDGGVDAGTAFNEGISRALAECSVVETYLAGGAPMVRNYPPPPSARIGDSKNAWKQAPYVKSATRSGPCLIFQVWSKSDDAWIVGRARVETPQGEPLEVIARGARKQQGHWTINVIVAAAPLDAKVSRLRLDLGGQDGRVAQTTVEDLP